MANLYADEQFPLPIVVLLRELNHNIITVQEAGNAGLSDPEVLEFAINNGRAVLTQNRRDFIKLHSQNPNHAGIIAPAKAVKTETDLGTQTVKCFPPCSLFSVPCYIVCTNDRNIERLADRINQAIAYETTLLNKLIRVNRPQ